MTHIEPQTFDQERALFGSHITVPEVGTILRHIPEAVGEFAAASQNQTACG